jgi:glycosyltransferase involved in cell wall biosynthesis
MAERMRVALIYQNNENWIGGTYYIQNLVLALNKLPDNQKPELEIITSEEFEFLQIEQLGYPYLKHRLIIPSSLPLPFYKRLINKISNVLTGFDRFEQLSDYRSMQSSIVFPAVTGMVTRTGVKKIFWIPDFQEQILPEFFSKNEIINRTQSHRYIVASKEPVVFSSRDAYNTFCNKFQKARNKRFILRFAVTHPEYQNLDIGALKIKFKIDKPYFFVSNQFWKHKNHLVILKALERIIDAKKKDFIVVFSGKEFDFRNPQYPGQVKQYAFDHGMDSYTKFLGFIDRKEQLKLMSAAIAVIQPSLFEGWSTVVEDAKAMNQFVIASDLPVHKEQLCKNVRFIKSNDENQLAEAMLSCLVNPLTSEKIDYTSNVSDFANEFIKMIKEGIGQ